MEQGSGEVQARGIAEPLIAWQAEHGRHGLPWQRDPDPYRVWLSEVMLQQTQVTTVLGYFERFLARWPKVSDLAAASQDEVLAAWSGLGYYSRARNLHRAAQKVMQEHGGVMPRDAATLATLPGIGRSTAAAIAAFSHGERAAILDGNVRRVLSRVHEVQGDPAASATLARLWALAEAELPQPRGDGQAASASANLAANAAANAAAMAAYTQGLMDLGATVCTRSRPACLHCPLNRLCAAQLHGTVAAHPAARRRTVRPVVNIVLWLLLQDDAVWLLQRPDTGIWGGLWSLPEPDEAALLLDPAGGAPRRHARDGLVDHFSHALTHRELRIGVERLRLEPDDDSTAAPPAGERRWHRVRVGELDSAPLPGPVKARIRGWIQAPPVAPDPGPDGAVCGA